METFWLVWALDKEDSLTCLKLNEELSEFDNTQNAAWAAHTEKSDYTVDFVYVP